MALAKKVLSGSSAKQIIIVDDHPLMRGGLSQLINQQSDLKVCGEAGNARDALELVSLKPDLAVVDISLEGKSGLELIRDLRVLHPDLPVLVISMHDESIYAERALRAGARGFVMKRAGGAVVLTAIRQVLNGRIFLSDQMSNSLLQAFSNGGPANGRRTSPIENLTDREFEVFTLIGEGLITREIAGRLHISQKTVDAYRQNLKEKLSLSTATSLVQHAVRWVETENRP